jgi:hypothetical protein
MALLNAVLNIQDPNVELGQDLSNLKIFSEGETAAFSSGPCLCEALTAQTLE